ncbi:hypothetical protein TTHERM_000624649 (macronuclear) [Tetrahymena thermophila SB210]|uniref:Uncharacterized protein n=1 Tax=Tetrahymena thermophila (strain SB210) TaxID=312017 RepID=W7X5N0_TETTS|nr:hypothetical protein TTHERM_000624649 [Tetrahymena thermophila SB210]EWS72702.1 hypothetical protein TTHERM_000624649 [Tetrahymena thermophila SB210]|eukprot:XP_012654778.1 hypothetical protein TTHERM_000624649 [Tetrahymena thermophila SB210]
MVIVLTAVAITVNLLVEITCKKVITYSAEYFIILLILCIQKLNVR